MSRLQKFIESGPDAESPTRVVYVLGAAKLPKPQEGRHWLLVENFSVGDEILKDARLVDVFKAAIDNGYAILNLKA